MTSKTDQATPYQSKRGEKLRDIQARFMLGSENELEQWTTLDRSKRARESMVFASLFVAGCLLVLLADHTTGGFTTLLVLMGVLLMGIAYNSLGLFIHEGLHGGLSKNKSNNMRWAFLIGIPLLISATAYRVTHTYHHIELGQARDFGTYKQHTRKKFIVWLCYYLQLFAGSFIYIACIPFLGYRHASRRIKRQVLVEYALIATVFVLSLVVLPNHIIVQFWLWPILVMNVLTNIRGLASHALGDTSDPLLASRTIKASRYLSSLLLYENYHLAHHLFPKIPSYNLKAVHDHIWHQVPHACYNRSYWSFLIDFIKASMRGSLVPLGYIRPNQQHAGRSEPKHHSDRSA